MDIIMQAQYCLPVPLGMEALSTMCYFKHAEYSYRKIICFKVF